MHLLIYICLDFWNLSSGVSEGLLPKSAMTAEEEAWNAYPYSKCSVCSIWEKKKITIIFISVYFTCLVAKTRYTCPFVEKFSLEIETYYYPDDGHQENVFNLDGSDLRNRVVGKYELEMGNDGNVCHFGWFGSHATSFPLQI